MSFLIAERDQLIVCDLLTKFDKKKFDEICNNKF